MTPSVNNISNRIGLIKRMTTRAFNLICLIVGISSSVLLLISLTAPVFLPPLSPTWTAEQVVEYYRKHHHGVQAGAACLILASAGYSTLVALIYVQLERIPNVPKAALILQLVGGTGIACWILISGFFVAIAVFRLDRPAELTQMLNDMFWLCFTLPAPLLQVQSFATAWAVLVDNRPRPYFPKYLAIFNIAFVICAFPTLAAHTVFTGPLAYDGSFNFWIITVIYVMQQVIECTAIWRALWSETKVNGEESS